MARIVAKPAASDTIDAYLCFVEGRIGSTNALLPAMPPLTSPNMETMMTFQTESGWLALEFELQNIQNEIDRRHSRIDQNVDRGRNLEKIAALREKKNKISQRLAAISR